MKPCPYCAESIQDEAIKCRFCGEMLVCDEEKRLSSSQAGSPTLKFLGALLFIGGLVAAVYYYQYFDTTVVTPQVQFLGQTMGGDRIHNIGLMQERQNGLMISGVVAAAGFVLVLVGQYLRPANR